MASGSSRDIASRSSMCSDDCIRKGNIRAPASAWLFVSGWSSSMGATSGSNPSPAGVASSISHFPFTHEGNHEQLDNAHDTGERVLGRRQPGGRGTDPVEPGGNPCRAPPVRDAGRRSGLGVLETPGSIRRDRKSTRLNSSHGYISYAVFCLKKKKK